MKPEDHDALDGTAVWVTGDFDEDGDGDERSSIIVRDEDGLPLDDIDDSMAFAMQALVSYHEELTATEAHDRAITAAGTTSVEEMCERNGCRSVAIHETEFDGADYTISYCGDCREWAKETFPDYAGSTPLYAEDDEGEEEDDG